MNFVGARKLACSKEPDGCGRCKREGIACYYSPQKPMGRPRKRRHADGDNETVSTSSKKSPKTRKAISIDGNSPSPEPLGSSFNTFEALPMASQPSFIEPSLAFMEPSHSPGMNQFLDLTSDFYQTSPYGSGLDMNGLGYSEQHHIQHTPAMDASQTLAFSMGEMPTSITGFDLSQTLLLDPSMQPMTDDCANPPSLGHGSHFSDSPEACPSPPLEQMYHLDAANAYPDVIRKSAPTVSCPCLSSLYFALESLSSLPKDIPSALRVARGASKIAFDVISCNSCFGLDCDVIQGPTMQALNNFSFLANLIPSTCNAYATILEMVHAQANRAKQQNRSLRVYYWLLADQVNSGMHNGMLSSLGLGPNEHKDIHPDLWRQIMCSIIRSEIHGSDQPMHVRPAGTISRSNGLKGIVAFLDERSNSMHSRMDQLHAAGQLPNHRNALLCSMPYTPQQKEERHCVRTLHLARVALDNLVIV